MDQTIESNAGHDPVPQDGTKKTRLVSRIQEEVRGIFGKKVGGSLNSLYNQAQSTSVEHSEWSSEDPKTIIDKMIDAMPDEVTYYTKETIDQAPQEEPSPIELYLMSRLKKLPSHYHRVPEGALRTMESIACLRDQVRTKKFLLGIRDTIEFMSSSERERIEMCDAGSGALPIMAIYAALSSDKVRCTALELNPDSAEIAQELVQALGLEDRIKILQTDATTYQPEKPIDFLVSETMNAGLFDEPVVQILSNLQPHVKADGTIFPSDITIKTALVSLASIASVDKFISICGEKGRVNVDADWQEVVRYKPGDPLDSIQLSIPVNSAYSGKYRLAVATTVGIGNQRLDLFQSLLTVVKYALNTDGSLQIFDLSSIDPGHSVELDYRPGDSIRGIATFN